MHPQFEAADRLSREAIGAGIEVHLVLGPGLLASICEKCLARKFELRRIAVLTQKPVRIEYKGLIFDEELKCDLLVGGALVVEIKAVREVIPINKMKAKASFQTHFPLLPSLPSVQNPDRSSKRRTRITRIDMFIDMHRRMVFGSRGDSLRFLEPMSRRRMALNARKPCGHSADRAQSETPLPTCELRFRLLRIVPSERGLNENTIVIQLLVRYRMPSSRGVFVTAFKINRQCLIRLIP